MTALHTTTKGIGAFLRNHFDAALLLAAATEIPRWTFAFAAIHEPMWAGVALGALLAYAASEGWKTWFAARNRTFLLALNCIALGSAIVVITPVLYAMIDSGGEAVNLSAALGALHPQARWAWSVVLAATTFLPLIQLAATKGYGNQAAASQSADGRDATVAFDDGILRNGNLVQRSGSHGSGLQVARLHATESDMQLAEHDLDDDVPNYGSPECDANPEATEARNRTRNPAKAARRSWDVAEAWRMAQEGYSTAEIMRRLQLTVSRQAVEKAIRNYQP